MKQHITDELKEVHEAGNRVLESITVDAVSEKSVAVLMTDSLGQHKEHTYFPDLDDNNQIKVTQSQRKKKTAKRPENEPVINDSYFERAKNRVDSNVFKNLDV